MCDESKSSCGLLKKLTYLSEFMDVSMCPRQEGSRFYGLRCVRWCKGPKQEKQQVKNQNESSCWAGIRTYRTVVGYVVGDFFGRCKGHLTSEPVRKEMTKKLTFTAQRKFVLHVLVSHVPCPSLGTRNNQIEAVMHFILWEQVYVGYVTRQWLACTCDACSLWKGRYDETNCENAHR